VLPVREMSEMVRALLSGGHRIYFEVGKWGRKDRFVLAIEENPSSRRGIAEIQTEPGAETMTCLRMLDELVLRNGEYVGLMYSNARKRGYCLWVRMGDRTEWAVREIAPVYGARMTQQAKILAARMKRGSVNFGFLPFEGGA